MSPEKIMELETNSIQTIDAMNQLAFEIRNSDTQRSISLSKKSQELSAQLNYMTGLATSLSNEAFCYVQITNYELALEKLFEALKIFEETRNEKGVAQVHYNLCLVYYRFSDFSSGLDSITKAVTYYKKVNDKSEIARCLFQLGFVYNSLSDAATAIEYFNQSISLSKELNNKASEAASIMGLGQVHRALKEYDKCHTYLSESMRIREEIKDWRGYAATLNAYLTLCLDTEKYDEAQQISIKGIKLATELGDKMGISRFMLDLGKTYVKQNKVSEGEKTILEALDIAEKINLKMALVSANQALAEIYESKGEFEKSLHYFKEFHKIREETMNTNAAMKAKSIQFVGKIESAQKEAEINRLKNVELKNAFEEIAEKNNEITASINYAKRIQNAILPPQKIVKQYLQDSFILYKPKDIVAGDFYWMETVDDLILFAACDCTGHGVPGAMVSVVCHNALNKAVREFGLTQPAAILDKTAEIVIENFSKSEEDIKDGMDVSLCAYNPKTKKLQWAGANNPLWLVQNGELVEIKADKQPIGMNEYSKPFTNHTFELNTGNTIYLFTDGYADQFGGEPVQKKLTKKRFKELILSLQTKPMSEQGTELDSFMTNYRKDVEQIDDVLVMGVKI